MKKRTHGQRKGNSVARMNVWARQGVRRVNPTAIRGSNRPGNYHRGAKNNNTSLAKRLRGE